MNDINNHINKLDDLLIYCNAEHKNEVYKRIEYNLRSEGKLRGEALKTAMDDLKNQYEDYLKNPKNQMNLKKFVEIASENLNSIKHSKESITIAGKLNTLMFYHQQNPNEKTFSFPFMATLEEKAEKLEHALKGNYSKKELDNYFQTSELDRNFKIAEPVKKTLWKLADSQVKNYAQNNIFHLSDSLELIDSKLNDLLKFFSPGQRTALFQGIAEMTDQEQSFRQLFSSLHNTYSQNAPQLLESFPRDHFIHYFVNNLKNIQKENLPSGGSFFTLNRIIVHGRLNPVVELLVLHAIEKNDYASINKILSYMQFHFDLKNPIDCKYLTEDQIATFKNNSTLDMQFKKMKNIDDYMQ